MSNDAEETFEIAEGMTIVNPDGDELGRVAAILIDEEEDEVAFLLIRAPTGGEARLLPVDAVEDAEDGKLVVDLPPASVDELPQIPEDRDPTDAEIDLAYAVAGLGD